MKKFIIPLFSFICLIIILLFVTWFNIPNIVAHFLTKDFGVPVSIENITYSKNVLSLKKLDISNPKNSKTKTAFFSNTLDIKSTMKEIREEVLTIDSITLNDLKIGIEFYNKSGSENNWATIMQMPPAKKKSDKKRKYLIKRLTLNNIGVTLAKPDGTRQTFPTIEKLEFYNISDETGFPIDEIEKAIAHAVLKSILQKFSLENILKTISPQNIIKTILPFGG